MYLTQLRELKVSHTNWPTQANQQMLTICFDIADATLNSWKDAHDAFAMRIVKPNHPKFISYGVHYAFTRLVIRAFQDCEDDAVKRFATNKFPSECIAYALLVLWLEKEVADAVP